MIDYTKINLNDRVYFILAGTIESSTVTAKIKTERLPRRGQSSEEVEIKGNYCLLRMDQVFSTKEEAICHWVSSQMGS